MDQPAVYICIEYDRFSRKTGKTWMVLALEDDKWNPGDLIKINGKDYILSNRTVDRKKVVHYRMYVAEEITALPLD